jgi:hypothetical protein
MEWFIVVHYDDDDVQNAANLHEQHYGRRQCVMLVKMHSRSDLSLLALLGLKTLCFQAICALVFLIFLDIVSHKKIGKGSISFRRKV